MENLDNQESLDGNKCNGRGCKRVEMMAGEIGIETPKDLHRNYNPEIIKKREAILADNMS